MKKLKSAIITPFVVVFVLTFTVIFLINLINTGKSIKKLSDNKVQAITDVVEMKLEQFLNEPLYLGITLSHMVDFSVVNKENGLSSVQDKMNTAMTKAYHLIPQIELIGFGAENGDLISFKKNKNKQNESYLILRDKRTDNRLNFYANESIDSQIVMSLSDYDSKLRPWYISAVEAGKPTWSDVYDTIGFHGDNQSTLSAVVPCYDGEDKINGVVAVDIRIETLAKFLKSLSSEYGAEIYIFDRNKNIIASSSFKDASAAISESMEYVSELKEVGYINGVPFFETKANDEVYYNNIVPYVNSNDFGFNWYIGVSVPKSSLFKELTLFSGEKVAGFLTLMAVLLLGLLVGILRLNRIIVPIQEITESANKLSKGLWDKKIKVEPNDGIEEINSLVDSFNFMFLKLDKSFKELKRQVGYDRVTGLNSSRGFVECYKNLEDKSGTLFVFSIKSFDNIKNSLGYHIGDLLLQKIAKRLKSIASDSLIARLEGGEFAYFIPAKLDFEQSKSYAIDVKKLLTKEVKINNVNIAFRISVGIVMEPEQYRTMGQSLRNGCLALAKADQAHSHVYHYEMSVLNDIEHKTIMLPCIKKAIEDQEFKPFYQPIVELKTGKIVGAEALARWDSSEFGFVSPMDFIPVAEENGYIEQVGEAILYQACLDTVKGIKEGKWPKDIRMHVNISVIQISNAAFLSALQNIIVRTKVNPCNLSLEITESSLIDNEGVFSRNLASIIAMGIHVSIDDFGTGYSSLSYLQDLQFDCLKIDRAFIQTLNQENHTQSLTAMILNISDSMGKYVVAEGIETEEQARLLVELECELGQGFYFGRPVPYAEWPESEYLPIN